MTWKEQLNEGLAAFGVQIPDGVPIDEWARSLGDNPCRNTAAVVALSSLLFYAAERDHNPKVNDVFDAAIYCSTCLSVGYGDIFAKTPLGKLLGTALMTVGPALSGAALDGPAATRRDEVQGEILTTLKQILEKMQAPE
ncbi:MAG TPA: potassium channel family protein [Tepidisphaeraceae bacterium]|nr:potassium channel family protein [Tepidisphaeraceae bacterium]